ncbi:hypothetical protein RB653_006751 [Dictyostelium firmibasis]|uniref:Uncharacterized protein n=1 Tax=Dictyostelium firmibasis TaxID=79012 RepID=A0AAN7TUM2_9MYCE
MDDAEKEKLLIKLNTINCILEERISILITEIENQKKLIENDKYQLHKVTEEIVRNEEEKAQIIKERDTVLEELAKLESEMKDYQKEIDSGLEEINSLAQQLNGQTPKNDALSIVNRVFNPVGSLIDDIVFLCTNNIKEIEGKMNDLASELGLKAAKYEELYRKKDQSDYILNEKNWRNSDFTEQRAVLERKLKEIGIQKTYNENFKLDLDILKSKCQLSIDDTNQGKDLLGIGFNLVNEIEENVKSLFSSNGLSISF